MATTTRRLLLAPLLAVCLTAATLVGTLGAARADGETSVRTLGHLLRVRSGPSTQAPVVGLLSNGAAVHLDCQQPGEYVTGAVRNTAQWDRLTSGGYVSHAFVVTESEIPPCGQSAPAPRVRSSPIGTGANAEFIAAAVPAAQRNQREYAVPASVTIAQAIIESGWGRSSLASNDHNYFGIKCFRGFAGSIANGCHSYRTVECEPGCAPTTASFRVYPSIADSFRDHGSFLTTNSRYAPAFAQPRDANLFIWQVWKAGYATSPRYFTDVTDLMIRYNLYQYDLG